MSRGKIVVGRLFLFSYRSVPPRQRHTHRRLMQRTSNDRQTQPFVVGQQWKKKKKKIRITKNATRKIPQKPRSHAIDRLTDKTDLKKKKKFIHFLTTYTIYKENIMILLSRVIVANRISSEIRVRKILTKSFLNSKP